MPATLDDHPIKGPRKPLNSGVFTARVSPEAPQYADSVALEHPGRLATVYCGFKAKVHLRPGTHTIVVDYSAIFPYPANTSTSSRTTSKSRLTAALTDQRTEL